ncbi:hypothetical protein JWG40_10505 [Leptospira sp. 201903074]|uniref:hypothetical protein n=1 Tax=Leptospira abararensis TaxID=2810036 RepID=UPI0019649299|nr:hypothetical protein [Leptospira abararensis]MBM9547448.1 hypothetical protein [Leptospira abararensis]
MNQLLPNEIGILNQISSRFRPKTDIIYDDLYNLTTAYKNLNIENRKIFRESLPTNIKKKLLGFSGFLAEYAIFKTESKYISAALLFHCIEDFSIDPRENIRYLILINHSSNLLGYEFKKFILAEINNCSDEAKKYFIEFMKRDKSLNSLDKFEMQLMEIDNFPIYTMKK